MGCHKTTQFSVDFAVQELHSYFSGAELDLGDGQFSERCDFDGSFFNNDAIPFIFGKSLTSPSSRLFSLTIGNEYFSIILFISLTDWDHQLSC